MTVWADDDEGKVQVEMGKEGEQYWLSFNKSTSVLVMTRGEAEQYVKEMQELLAQVDMQQAQGGQLEVVEKEEGNG